MNSQLIYKIRISKSASIRLLGYSVLLTFIALIFFGKATGDYAIGPDSLLLSIFIYIAAVMLHEFTHGFFFKIFGGNPRYGVGFAHFIPIAYATSPGTQYAFWQMLTIGLAPFFLISLLSVGLALLVPILAPFLSIVFMGNFVGAVGDIWLSSKMWNFRRAKNTYFVDLADGVGVKSNDKQAKMIAKKLKANNDPSKVKNIFISRWVGCSFIIFSLIISIPILLSVFKVDGDILLGAKNFPIIDYSSTAKTVGFSLNIWLPTLIGLIYASLLYVLDRSKDR